MSNVGDSLDVDELKRRVGRRLDPDQTGVGTDGGRNLGQSFKDFTPVNYKRCTKSWVIC